MYIYSFNDALRSIAYKPLYLQLSLPTIIFAGNLCIQYFSCHIFLHVIFHMILLANISLQMGKCSWEKRENELNYILWRIEVMYYSSSAKLWFFKNKFKLLEYDIVFPWNMIMCFCSWRVSNDYLSCHNNTVS